ncbi:histone deacetylase complex, catalytic component RPD3 [Exidia glandulosa HHB12029]|uniref:histone deacetylase n=1 Tax=Exidia glandulosa HHB12029 TaxID=1314781 RepID=A0A165I881_EXIGL|nr:histone deacetylase complex, catalytic component RPD3 [Exidia glandulosa HHB12029]
MSTSKRRVSYFYDPDLGAMSYGWNAYMKPFRMRMTHHLIASYGMLDHMHVLRPKRATALQMTAFHTDEYIDFLTKVTPETCTELLAGRDFLAPELDNPPWDGLFEFCSISAGGSLDAAQRLADGSSDIAINWSGGLHHAKKRSASGFCYVNDIVLCILELLRTTPRVVYIDIDCHHGDGVEEAFYSTDRVLTVSFHKFGDFFPGTGALGDRGRGTGTGYAVNVPLMDGVCDESFASVFEPVIGRIVQWYQPGAIVLQCGADSLAGDRLGCLNLSMEGHARCVEFVRELNVPLVLLGGGGYTVRNVARTWTYETACALGKQNEIERDLPFNEFFEWFGPRYRLEVPRSNMEDLNMRDKYLEDVR